MTGGCERIAACRLMNVQRQSERTEARGESVRAAGSRRRRRASRSNQGEGEAEGRTLELVEMAAQRIRLRDEPGVYDRWDRHTAACALHHRAHRKHRATNALQVKAVQKELSIAAIEEGKHSQNECVRSSGLRWSSCTTPGRQWCETHRHP